MMQWVLSIDFSAQPCELSLSSVEGNQVEVDTATQVDLPLLTHRDDLLRRDLAPLFKAISLDTASSSGGDEKTNEQERDSSTQTSDLAAPNDPLYATTKESIERLKATIRSLPREWTGASVIIPPHDHLALNLNLPFGDSKNLDRIVDLEVQDVVPFELDDFVVQYSPLGPSSLGGAALAVNDQPTPSYDVHVGLMPRLFVRNLLFFCKAVGIEPNIITVPSSALASVYHLGKDFFKTNSAVVFNRGDEFSMAVFINGEVRVERVLFASRVIAAAPREANDHPLKAVFAALKLMLAATERRYGARVENVYLLGREVKGTNSQQLFGRPIQSLHLNDFVKGNGSSVGLSALSAPFAADGTGVAPLSNFRSREFSFTPRIGEFLRALVGTTRYIKLAIGGITLAALSIYLMRAYTISSIQRSLKSQIASVIPSFDAPPSEIRSALMKAESKLSEELGVLASPARVSPLDALLEILRLLPQGDNITISAIKISGTKAQITGTATQLSAIEGVGKALRANNGVFSKVTATPGSSAMSKFNFTVELILSQ